MRSSHTATPSRHTLAIVTPIARRHERGAVLVNMAIALVGLISFSALVVDYGVLWSARRQAQNAADAGAMAAAVSLAYVDFENHDLARTAAINTARRNSIWGAEPDITNADVSFDACPTGSPVASTNACVRVNVFRNQRPNGNPLPTIFGHLIGVADQGVRATATARVLFGDSSDCVKPWALADKWDEENPASKTWDANDQFRAHGPNGSVLVPADIYQPPGNGASNGGAGTGFARESADINDADFGRQITFKLDNPSGGIATKWVQAVDVCGGCLSATRYRDAIEQCTSSTLGPGDTLPVEAGNLNSDTVEGVNTLYDQDPGAQWSTSANGGKGGIVGGCQANGTCQKSPRLVAVPIVNVDTLDQDKQNGAITSVTIVKVVGFFIERRPLGNDIVGRLTFYPGQPRIHAAAANIQAASFIVSVALVR